MYLSCLTVAIKNKAKRLAREEQWAKDAKDRDAVAAGPKEDVRKNKGKNKNYNKDSNNSKVKDKDSRRPGEMLPIEENHGGEKKNESEGEKIIKKKERKAERIARLAEEKRKRKEREKSEQGRDEVQDLCTAHNMHKVRGLLSQISKHLRIYLDE